MPVPPGLLRKIEAGLALRGRGGGSVTPRAMTMISRRTADSAGLNRRRIARWRRRGRVGGQSAVGRRQSEVVGPSAVPDPDCPLPIADCPSPSPAMATSAATMRFNAPWFLSIAMFQSIAVAPCGGILGCGGRCGDKPAVRAGVEIGEVVDLRTRKDV